MSKEIFLYSEDKKYKCGIELAESTDRFGCPDHSMIVLFEEREDGTYIIAEARDMLLETQKDKQIAQLKAENENLQQQLKGKDKRIENLKQANESFTYFIEKIITYYGKSDICYKDVDNFLNDIVKDNTKQVCEKIREKSQGLWYFVLQEQKEHFEGNRYVLSQKDFNDILDQIENEKKESN